MAISINRREPIYEKPEIVFSNGSLVYIDTSFLGVPGKKDCFDILRGKSEYSSINSKDLETVIGELEDFGKVFDSDVSLTIPEVVSEVSGFNKGIKRACRYFAERNSRGHEDMKLKFRRLKGVIGGIYARAKEVQVEVVDRKYDLLVEMVVDLSKSFNLKRDNSYWNYNEHKRDKSHDNDTDERLVAMAYYSSLYDGLPVSILSNDGDHLNLLEETSVFMGAMSSFNNRFFRWSLGENFVRSYRKDLRRPSLWRVDYDSRKISFPKKTELNSEEHFKLNLRMKRRFNELYNLEKIDS
ncbi:hypothetical protein CMI46_03065 [Candidatus Pacearchaeota archaeon]|nr:hypothetical protein [Candidatus Pacearchaeota archaeon]|tara:strand:+ start:3280 stop:4170 length:891 start_codon:yes stop_codon:yes gene_type:complete